MDIKKLQIHQVLLRKGFNPRTDMGEPLDDSILSKGIYMPLQAYSQELTLLVPNEDGTGSVEAGASTETIIVEGHRRIYSLARALGHKRVELIAQEADGSQTTYYGFEPDPESTAKTLPKTGEILEPWHKHAEIPLIIRDEWADDATERLFAALRFGSNESGSKPLNMVEKGNAFLQLQQEGQTQQQIAEATDYSATHISDCIELVTFVDTEIIQHVLAGRMSATTALDLAKATMTAPSVPDMPQQVIHFRSALAKATENGGEDARVTAKHIPIPIGKAAAAAAATVPFTDVESADSTVDGEGRIWKSEEETLPLPEHCKAHAKILIAPRTIEDTERFFYGYEVKWPGLHKDDGYLKVLPSLKSSMWHPDRRKSRLAALGAIIAELGAHDFRTGNKPDALEALTALQLEAAKDFPEMHQPEPQPEGEGTDLKSATQDRGELQDPSKEDEEPENEEPEPQDKDTGDTESKDDEIPLSTVSDFFDAINAMRNEWRGLKGSPNRPMPEFDKALAHYREFCRSGGKTGPQMDLLGGIIANVPEDQCEPAALFMLQVIHGVFTQDLPELPTPRRTIEKALTGIFKTTEEIRNATHS